MAERLLAIPMLIGLAGAACNHGPPPQAEQPALVEPAPATVEAAPVAPPAHDVGPAPLKVRPPFLNAFVLRDSLAVNLPASSMEEWDRLANDLSVDELPFGDPLLPRDAVELGDVYVISERGVTKYARFETLTPNPVGWQLDYPLDGLKGPLLAMRVPPPEGTKLRPGGKFEPTDGTHPLARAIVAELQTKWPQPEMYKELDQFELQVVKGDFGAGIDHVAAVRASPSQQPDPEFPEDHGMLATVDAQGNVVAVLNLGYAVRVDSVLDTDGDGLEELVVVREGYETYEIWMIRPYAAERDEYLLEEFAE